MRRPRFHRSRSEKLAIHGSVMASHMRPADARMTTTLRTTAKRTGVTYVGNSAASLALLLLVPLGAVAAQDPSGPLTTADGKPLKQALRKANAKARGESF